MRLLRFDDGFKFSDHDDDKAPPYAILSHTWSEKNEEEVTYQDVLSNTTKSLNKLLLCREWALAAGYTYFWIDTCCIDKHNDAELAYAIRSMYRWYAQAGICFVYLSDLTKNKKNVSGVHWQESLKSCRWFTRGWTLQELIASQRVEFYACDGYLGSREDLLPLLSFITSIDLAAPLPGHKTRLGWIARRHTKRPEDRAYCMLGICGVMLSPQYGEGEEEARRRLETAIVQRYGTIALEQEQAAPADEKVHRRKILNLLRFSAMETRRTTISAATKNTCSWVLNHPACVKWLRSEHSFFWIQGKPGAGKSVMVKFLDEYVSQTTQGAAHLSFYFNARGDELEKTFKGMYRSLLVQLLDAVPHLQPILDTVDLSRVYESTTLQSTLAKAIKMLQEPVYVFLDAIDECHENDIQDMIDFFENLQHELIGLSICFASRHYPIYEIPTRLRLVLEDAAEHVADIGHYVATNLPLRSATAQRRAQIQNEIIHKANGVFLWTVLVVKILQKEVSAGRLHAVQARLREIPAGLKELFQDITRRDQSNMDEFILCLRWILYARRPLELSEFYYAMMAGLSSQDLRWDKKDVTREQMHSFLLTSSKGFAELTKGVLSTTTTTQFIHESVRDFLIKDNGFSLICGGSAERLECVAHEQLKNCCRRGYERICISRKREPHKSDYPFAEYALTFVLYHANQAAVSIPQQHFLDNEFDLADWTKKLSAKSPYSKHDKVHGHNQTLSFSYLCAVENFSRLVGLPNDALSQGTQQYGSPLVAAFMCHSWEVASALLLALGVANADEIISEAKLSITTLHHDSIMGSAPWRWALANGQEHLARHLLSPIPADEVVDNSLERHALFLAIEGGNFALYTLIRSMYPALMIVPAVFPELDEYGQLKPMMLAAALGHHEMLVDLLSACAFTHLHKDLDWAMKLAIRMNQERIVLLLMELGTYFNLRAAAFFDSALQTAAIWSRPHLVQMALDFGADVNSQGSHCGTALQTACSRPRSEEMVMILLKAGADVNARGGVYDYALQIAERRGDRAVAELLCNAGALHRTSPTSSYLR